MHNMRSGAYILHLPYVVIATYRITCITADMYLDGQSLTATCYGVRGHRAWTSPLYAMHLSRLVCSTIAFPLTRSLRNVL